MRTVARQEKHKQHSSHGRKKRSSVFCPAIADSPYGDAALIAESRGHHLTIDAIQDYVEFMGMGESVADTGVVYIGGGVPKDFIQLFAVTGDLLYEDRKVPGRAADLTAREPGCRKPTILINTQSRSRLTLPSGEDSRDAPLKRRFHGEKKTPKEAWSNATVMPL